VEQEENPNMACAGRLGNKQNGKSQVKVKCFNWLGICAIGVGLVLSQPEAIAAELLGLTGQEVQIVEYSSKDSSPVAKICADQMFIDYERHGFFRIGLLPILVAENTKIQIYSAACLTNALFALRQGLQSSPAARHLELRNLEVSIIGENKPRLLASRARIGNDNTLDLFNVSLTSPEGQVVSIPKATLQIAGGSAGKLSWNEAGRKEELFPLNPKTKAP
jgi:hypothetical protein